MNENIVSQDNEEPIPKPKILGLPRPLAGAFSGILLFTLIFFLFKSAGFIVVPAALLAPGIWANFILEAVIDPLPTSTYDFLSYGITFIVSSIPPAILGSLFISKKKESRTVGIILFIPCFIFSSFIALLAYAIGMD